MCFCICPCILFSTVLFQLVATNQSCGKEFGFRLPGRHGHFLESSQLFTLDPVGLGQCRRDVGGDIFPSFGMSHHRVHPTSSHRQEHTHTYIPDHQVTGCTSCATLFLGLPHLVSDFALSVSVKNTPVSNGVCLHMTCRSVQWFFDQPRIPRCPRVHWPLLAAPCQVRVPALPSNRRRHNASRCGPVWPPKAQQEVWRAPMCGNSETSTILGDENTLTEIAEISARNKWKCHTTRVGNRWNQDHCRL